MIGLVVLGALFGLYTLYVRVGGTQPAALRVQEPLPAPVMDLNDGEPNSQAGKIGPMNTEVVAIKQTRFFHRDDDGRIDREFGFEVFLHKRGDQWRFTHPYMKLFLPRLQCHVIADVGEVQVQTAFGQAIPNDALFQGNVVIHILPPEPGDPRECFIHLDDVSFIAERSLFTTTGPVRFISRSAVLEGTGMELIYDGSRSRLELFRIIDLQSLRIRSADIAMFTKEKKDAKSQEQEQTPVQVGSSAEISVASVQADGDPNRTPGEYYECILRRNVAIDTPERIVIAHDLLAIRNILWARSETDEQADESPAKEIVAPDEVEDTPAPQPLDTKPSTHLAIESMPLDLFDIVVTCDGGLVIAPVGAANRFVDLDSAAASKAPPGDASPLTSVSPDRQRAVGRSIEFDAATENAAFVGPVEITLQIDPNDLIEGRPGGGPMPMKVTAQDAVRFVAASNQVLFEGDCLAVMEKSDPNMTHEFTLSAPTFALDLMKDPNASTPERAIAVKHFATGGGPATIVVRRRAAHASQSSDPLRGEGVLSSDHVGDTNDTETPLLGWTRMRVAQLEYDTDARLLTTHGPGEMQVRNTQVSKPQTDPNAFGFDQPSYAFLRGFDLLTFASDTNRIVLASDSGPIQFDYIPAVGDKYGPHIWGDAGHLDLTLRRTPAGQMELASLVASDGITYEEEKGLQFLGDALTYDGDRSLLKVAGDDDRPCYLNGALVDGIEMDVKTREIKETRLLAPSLFQFQGQSSPVRP